MGGEFVLLQGEFVLSHGDQDLERNRKQKSLPTWEALRIRGGSQLLSRRKGHHHRVHACHMSDAIIDMRHQQRCTGVIERNTSSPVRMRVLT
jgi:hypothetical protein